MGGGGGKRRVAEVAPPHWPTEAEAAPTPTAEEEGTPISKVAREGQRGRSRRRASTSILTDPLGAGGGGSDNILGS
ncbi:MAG: hypothetical protein GY753_11950 [Gammaproteobacteria bacterium]|nr:hypothetical protein [Gammaproteobacteria bacterium]